MVGGKNASLGEMFNKLTKKGVNLPDGFAITTEAYWSFVKENKIDANPEEMEGNDGGVYYKFIVMQDNVEKYFTSSAWTLLGALKEMVPLKDKKVKIIKKFKKGKQTFEVS